MTADDALRAFDRAVADLLRDNEEGCNRILTESTENFLRARFRLALQVYPPKKPPMSEREFTVWIEALKVFAGPAIRGAEGRSFQDGALLVVGMANIVLAEFRKENQ